MNICLYKTTNLAQCPDHLASGINKYSEHRAVVSQNTSIGDFVHFNNNFVFTRTPSLMHYHSEPWRVLLNYKGFKVVNPQYHATLPEYQDCMPSKWMFMDLEDKQLYSQKIIDSRIKVGYSPSTLEGVDTYDKGVKVTTAVLKKLKEKFPEDFDFDIIYNVSFEECMSRKANCNIIIDECVTDSFHMSSFEGLGLGKLVICSMSSQISNNLLKISGASTNPIRNVYIKDLENFLENLVVTNQLQEVLIEGAKNRTWAEQYSGPQGIVNYWIDIYTTIYSQY